MKVGGGWMIELDIRHFYDSVGHGHLRTILDRRVRDGVIRRMIDKWLKAGVQHGRELSFPDDGTPQGGVVSPVLANVYLHEVLDVWFEQEVRPRLDGSASLIRYADDAVMIFEREADARRVMAVLAKRFARYGLNLHPTKTRLIDFRRPTRKVSAAASTFSASRTSGAGPGEATGWCSARPRAVASEGRSSES